MKPQLLVNSCTGKMGQAVAEAALRAGVELVPFTLCGPGEQKPVSIQGHNIALVGPSERDEKIAALKKQYPNLLAVDYTLPDAIHDMVDFYTKHNVPFVMGTTGGDRAKINAQVSAVVVVGRRAAGPCWAGARGRVSCMNACMHACTCPDSQAQRESPSAAETAHGTIAVSHSLMGGGRKGPLPCLGRVE